jgi:2-C-methyl-D-erythritol 2,4-cyclodiphosphate synthase
MRVGIGYDSHRFADGRKLILGGVEIPHPQGLGGHSDADVVTHALIDALLGAAALGDIGGMFPDTDPRWKNCGSLHLLDEAYGAVRARGLALVQCDLTVIAERPRVAPHVAEMRRKLATVLRVEPALVSVKGKTNEGMGWIGRGEGIAAIAVALLA